MKYLVRLLAIIAMMFAIPLGLYVWLKWGWYDGFVLAFNAIMNEPRDAGNFAWGVIKVLSGGFLGALTGYVTFLCGGLAFASTN